VNGYLPWPTEDVLMNKRILIVQGHPDAAGGSHLCHRLADAYVEGARAVGYEVRIVGVGCLDFPLWLGGMPALLKGFLEQVARPGFALSMPKDGGMAAKLLTGRSARIVVTMGMPTLIYRWYFRAHSVKALERNILGFVGIAPIHETLIGMVESLGDVGVAKWLAKLTALGKRAQ
jgi:putative NADPH-quinone reductase